MITLISSITIQKCFILLIIFVAACTARVQNVTRNYQNRCGGEILQYPFGFSEGSGIKLNCTENRVQVGGFQVQNVTSDSIFIYLPAKCNRSMLSIYPLFGGNFAPTRNNSFLVQDCEAALGGCVIPASSFLGNQIEVESCDKTSGNISCFMKQKKQENEGVVDSDFLAFKDLNETGCRYLFSAVAFGQSKEITVQFQEVELGWWLQGPCQCSANATCSTVYLQNGSSGFRCRCNDGFQGDGFANGAGCWKG